MNASKPSGAFEPRKQPLDLALIGNCRVAALVDSSARLVWWCFPRFDSNPVFSRLVSGEEEKGFSDVALADLSRVSSGYVHNTAIVETELEDIHGGRVRITDFAPRFWRYERMFHPPQLVRRIVPARRLAPHRDPRPPDGRLWSSDLGLDRRLQPYPLPQRRNGYAIEH